MERVWQLCLSTGHQRPICVTSNELLKVLFYVNDIFLRALHSSNTRTSLTSHYVGELWIWFTTTSTPSSFWREGVVILNVTAMVKVHSYNINKHHFNYTFLSQTAKWNTGLFIFLLSSHLHTTIISDKVPVELTY